VTTTQRADPLRRALAVADARARDVAQWVRDGVAAEGLERRVLWIVAALVLVVLPAVFTASRTTQFASQVPMKPQALGPLAAQYTPGYYEGFLAVPVVQQRLRATADAGPSEYRRATTATFAPDGTMVLTVRNSSPDRAQELAENVAREIVNGTARHAGLLRTQTIADINARLAKRPRPKRTERLKLYRQRRALVRLGPSTPPRVAVTGPATRPPLKTWADEVAAALPGDMPGRPSPLWAAFAGLLLLVALWVGAMTLAPPGGQTVRLLRRVVEEPAPRPRRTGAPALGPEPLGRRPLGLRWWWRAAWIAALAATPALTLALVVRYGVNVPFWDELTLVPVFQAHDTGTLSLHHFFAQHNEHRPAFPRAADFLTGLLTGWNLKVEMYRNFAVAIAGFGVILRIMRRTLDRTAFLAASIVASVVYFSPVQWENWLWGWELEWFLANLGVLAAVWALAFTIDRAPRLGLAAAAVCGCVATFSLGSGLLVWPAGLAVLLVRRRPWRIWLALSIVVPALYFDGWIGDEGVPSKSSFLSEPVDFVRFVLLYFGRSLGVNNATGELVGAVLIAAFLAAGAYVVRNRRDEALVDRCAPWLGIGLYALGTGVITGISRYVLQVAVSRYSTVAGLLAISAMALALVVARHALATRPSIAPRARRAMLAAAVVPLLLAALVNVRSGTDAMRTKGGELEAVSACQATLRSMSDPCVRHPRWSPYPETVAWLRYLRKKGWAGF
jgi:hypothetical protein